MSKEYSTEMIISEIKLHFGFKTDSELANFLGISQPVLANWKKRNTFDVNLIFTKCEVINANWLLTGEGNMLNSTSKKEEKININEFIYSNKILSESLNKLVDNNSKLVNINERNSELIFKLCNK